MWYIFSNYIDHFVKIRRMLHLFIIILSRTHNGHDTYPFEHLINLSWCFGNCTREELRTHGSYQTLEQRSYLEGGVSSRHTIDGVTGLLIIFKARMLIHNTKRYSTNVFFYLHNSIHFYSLGFSLLQRGRFSKYFRFHGYVLNINISLVLLQPQYVYVSFYLSFFKAKSPI